VAVYPGDLHPNGEKRRVGLALTEPPERRWAMQCLYAHLPGVCCLYAVRGRGHENETDCIVNFVSRQGE